jgi:hypothetical protein
MERLMRAIAIALFLAACGAREADRLPPDPVNVEPIVVAGDRAPEPSEEAAPAEEPPPPAPDPVLVEAGVRLGQIQIGMSEADVRALGLEESEVDSRSRRFGPYRVFFDGDSVRRVEAQIGAIGPVQIGDAVLPTGTHIHAIRDAIGDCEWTEGGGERYRCAGGSLFVHTTHSLDPALYTIAVEAR